MPSFGPIGASPISAFRRGSVAGVNYSPGTVTITFQGGAQGVVTGLNQIKFEQTAREVLRDGPESRMQIRQVAREVLRSEGAADPSFQTRQLVREVLRAGDAGVPEFQARQLVREVLRAGDGIIPEFHVRQFMREILRSSIEAIALRRRQLILPNVGPRL